MNLIPQDPIGEVRSPTDQPTQHPYDLYTHILFSLNQTWVRFCTSKSAAQGVFPLDLCIFFFHYEYSSPNQRLHVFPIVARYRLEEVKEGVQQIRTHHYVQSPEIIYNLINDHLNNDPLKQPEVSPRLFIISWQIGIEILLRGFNIAYTLQEQYF